MGRKKKETVRVSEEGYAYTLYAIKNYRKMKQHCDDFETAYPSLIRRCEINADAFLEDRYPTPDTFVEPDMGRGDQSKVDYYLAEREKVYLLEHSIWKMNAELREVAESLFLVGLPWETIMKRQAISRMTLSRMRKAAILQVAAEVDDYMIWKAQQLFL
jgi:hypothetical protein